MRKRRVGIAAMLFALALLAARSVADERQPGSRLEGKKLIEWDANEPNTAFLRANIARMERLPFDGIVFHLSGANFAWEAWGSRRFSLAEFQKPLDDLRATPFRRFTDRFLRVNVTPGGVDWFDDTAWNIVLENFALAARIARAGGCKGLLFDTEQYQANLFRYQDQKRRGKKSFGEYRSKVRQRGEQWISAINGQFPDVTILVTFGYEVAQPRTGGGDRSHLDYGLLPDFLDGALAACSKGTRIVDAWELAYGFKRQGQFQRAYDATKAGAPKWSALPEKYRAHLQVGFGIWLDNDWRHHGWNSDDPSKNYFSPAAFAESVREALRASDEYVWIYSEKPRWWTGEKLPNGYIEALIKAREPLKRPKAAR